MEDRGRRPVTCSHPGPGAEQWNTATMCSRGEVSRGGGRSLPASQSREAKLDLDFITRSVLKTLLLVMCEYLSHSSRRYFSWP